MTTTQKIDAKKIGEWAGLAFTPAEIAKLAGVPLADLKRRIADEADPVSQAYHQGLLLGEAAIRGGMLKASSKGSTDALRVLDNINDRCRDGGFENDVDIGDLLLTVTTER